MLALRHLRAPRLVARSAATSLRVSSFAPPAGAVPPQWTASYSTSLSVWKDEEPNVKEAEVVGEEPPAAAVEATETVTGPEESHVFQAETKQLLDIVTNSLYTDKLVFVRELISNASDATEKLRHLQASGETLEDAGRPLEIHLTTDEAAGTLTFTDAGVGLAKDELVEHIGTIARSGSKAFLQKLQEEGASPGNNIIGQFGVGFYSAFMVASDVTIFTKSSTPGQPAHRWRSTGDGSFDMAPADGVSRGTKVVLKLKDDCREYLNPKTLEDIIVKHSNFVSFPVFVNGKQINTVQALWSMSKSDITDEMYDGFFKFKAKSFEKPMYRFHFSSDVPIEVHALFFIGQQHNEKYGLGRQPPGVDLYSRKVLIEAETKVLPEWMRFVHGVIDSADIPLNISRESMQDSALMRRIRSLLTRRFLKFLDSEAKKDPEAFNKFFLEFGHFLKEGVCSEHTHQQEIAKLLRFESSVLPAGQLTSLDEYISRSRPGQDQIYYLVAPHRKLAEASPYMEGFRGGDTDDASETEVLYLYNTLDDFVMNNLNEFSSRKLVTAEVAELNLKDKATEEKEAEEEKKNPKPASGLSDTQFDGLSTWLMESALPNRLSKVKASTRLVSSPAVVTDHESASLRRMMRMLNQTGTDVNSPKAEDEMLPKQTLELNPSHPIVVNLNDLRGSNPLVAITVAEQLFDNALVAAGLLDDSRTMLPRLNRLLELVAAGGAGAAPPAAVEDTPASSEKDAQEKAAQDFMADVVADAMKKTGLPSEDDKKKD